MRELKQRTIAWLRKKFGDELYDDLYSKRTVEDVADYFWQNNLIEEVEAMGGLDVCLESWTVNFTAAKEIESSCSEEEIRMMEENAIAMNQGLPPVYSFD